MEELSQRELRNESGRIMRALAAGRSFVVNSNGRPVGELRPLRRSRFVGRVTVAEAFRNAPRLDISFRDDVDAVIDQEVTPRA